MLCQALAWDIFHRKVINQNHFEYVDMTSKEGVKDSGNSSGWLTISHIIYYHKSYTFKDTDFQFSAVLGNSITFTVMEANWTSVPQQKVKSLKRIILDVFFFFSNIGSAIFSWKILTFVNNNPNMIETSILWYSITEFWYVVLIVNNSHFNTMNSICFRK